MKANAILKADKNEARQLSKNEQAVVLHISSFGFQVVRKKQHFIGKKLPFGHFNVCTSIVIVYLCVLN